MALSATSPSSSTIGLQTRRRGWQGEREAARALGEFSSPCRSEREQSFYGLVQGCEPQHAPVSSPGDRGSCLTKVGKVR